MSNSLRTTLIGVFLGALLTLIVVGNLQAPLDMSNLVSQDSESIKEISLNGSKFSGEKVTVYGNVGFHAGPGEVTHDVENSAGYQVKIYCSDYLDNYKTSKKYKITGVVKNGTYTNYNFNRETYYYIECTKPPE